LAAAVNVRQLVLTHHDPSHDDAAVAAIETRAREHAKSFGYNLEVSCAFEGLELSLESQGARALAVAPPAPQADRDAVPGKRVLVVDDDPDIRALANKALTQDGHTVSEAGSGREALALIAAHVPDLLVLDLLMPEQGGLEVLQILRSQDATAMMPVVVLTAMDDEINTRSGFALGATDYVTKPFSIPQLAARVRACFARVP
jgi:CheY-like chemotaxis protein